MRGSSVETAVERRHPRRHDLGLGTGQGPLGRLGYIPDFMDLEVMGLGLIKQVAHLVRDQAERADDITAHVAFPQVRIGPGIDSRRQYGYPGAVVGRIGGAVTAGFARLGFRQFIQGQAQAAAEFVYAEQRNLGADESQRIFPRSGPAA